MAIPTPKTIRNDLIEQVNEIIKDGRYISEESTLAKKYLAEASKLMNANPSDANFVKAAIFQICGNVEKVKYHLKNAVNLGPADIASFNIGASIALSNMLLFSESQSYFRGISEPNTTTFGHILDAGLSSLSIIKLNELFAKANLMQLNYDQDHVQLTARMEAILKASNISDAQLAKYADVFGTVLRENNFMIKTEYPEITIADNECDWYPATLFIIFKIATDPQNAARLYKEGTRRLIKQFSEIPDALHFSVESF